MAILTDLRIELAEQLTNGGLRVVDYIPERIAPPIVIVAAGDPWVQEVFDKKTFNHDYQINMEVTLVAGMATNKVSTAQLDDLVEKAVIALHGEWACDVGQPFGLQANGAEYLAATVSINTTIQIS